MNSINGLTLLKTKSEIKTSLVFDELDMIKYYIKTESSIVAYLDNEVLIGKYNQGFDFFENQQIEKKFIKRLRIFNKNEELNIWRSQGTLKGRYRTDEKGEKTDFIEANQVLYGTNFEIGDKYTIISEPFRGIKIILPGKWQANNGQKRVAIRTRHYIGYLNEYQATYIDARFFDFVQLPIKGEK
jgi:CRISPR-associated protein (TIGR03984 family)